MWFLCLQIVLFVAGAYALVAGKLPLTDRIKLEGKRARIVGAILMFPVTVPICYGVLFTLAAILTGHTEDWTPNAAALDDPVTFGAIALALVYTYFSRPNNSRPA